MSESVVKQAKATTDIQTLIFDKDIFTRDGATRWAEDHDFRFDKIDETEDSYRLRQKDPGRFKTFRTISLRDGIKAVVAKDGSEVVEKGFLNGNPEGGMHAHVLDRNAKRTLRDGAHRHAFLLPDGGIIVTEENGEHVHDLESVDDDYSLGFDPGSRAEHSHKVMMNIEGETIETEAGGNHEHELMAETSGFDGLHTHELVLEDGTRLISLTPGDWVKHRGAPAFDLPPSPPASGYTSVMAQAIAQALMLVGKEREGVEMAEVSDADAVALAALGISVAKEGYGSPPHEQSEEKKKKKKRKKRADMVRSEIEKEWEHEDAPTESKLLSRVRILKKRKRDQVIYGVVLEPETVDAQGDIISKEEIGRAMHFYMKNSRVVGMRHKDVANGTTVVECFQAPHDIIVGSQVVKDGSWVLGVHVEDKKTWGHIESGALNAFSVGGWALRRPER
jgi:hypothetical protein